MALIKQDIFASLVREKFEGRIILAKMAVDLGYLDPARNKQGEKIRFPKWGTLSDAEIMTRGMALTPSDLTQTDSFAMVQHIGKAVPIYDVDELQAVGGGTHIDEAADQIAKVLARAVDKDLGKECRTSPLKVTATTDFAQRTDFAKAMSLFLDDQDAISFAGIVVSSLQAHFLYDWEDFTNLDFTVTAQGNGIVRKDVLLGRYRGIPVYVANNSSLDTASGKMYSYFIRKNALALMFQRDVNVETQRQILYKKTDVAGDMLYACKNVDDSGIVFIESAIPTIV